MPKKFKVYCRRRKYVKEVEDLRELYDREYFNAYAYGGYTFQTLRRTFLGRIRFVKKFYREKGRLLDVGCALGYFVKCALDEGFDAYGIDFSKYAIEEAKKLVGDRVICADVEEKTPFEDNYFDVVTAWDLLEHLKAPNLFLKRISNILKKNGLIFLITLNYHSFLSRIMKERWLSIAPGYHQTHTITPTYLRNWLNRAGLKEITLYTDGFLLKTFSNKFNSPIYKRLAGAMESVLYFPIPIMLRLFRPLNLGDATFCVAKRV